MKIRESHLRRVVRDELRSGAIDEQRAVGTGGGLSGYTPQQKNQIADKLRLGLEKRLLDAGVLLPGDTWSVTVNIGKHAVFVGKKAGAMEGVRDGEIKPHLKALANDGSVIDRDNLRFGRMLKLSLSNTAAKAVEVPDQSAPSIDRPRRQRKYDKTDCVKKQQIELGVTADGLWGPNTQRAWDAKYPGVEAPGPRDGSNLPVCKEKKPDEEDSECPEGQEWPGPPYAPDVCEPIKDDDDDDVPPPAPTQECKVKGEEVMKFMEDADNPLLNPGFYADVTNDSGLMLEFGEIWDWAEFNSEMTETLRLMEKVMKCDCIGPTGHVEAAQELVLQIRTNSDNFGDAFNPFQLFFRIQRIGVRKFYDFLASIWNAWEFTNWLTGKDLPRVESLTWSRAGMTGWIPGFDPLSRVERDGLLALAAELDALDICDDVGEEYEEVEVEEVEVEGGW